MKKDEELAKNPPVEDTKKLDLSFKEGQTIKINIGVSFRSFSALFPPGSL